MPALDGSFNWREREKIQRAFEQITLRTDNVGKITDKTAELINRFAAGGRPLVGKPVHQSLGIIFPDEPDVTHVIGEWDDILPLLDSDGPRTTIRVRVLVKIKPAPERKLVGKTQVCTGCNTEFEITEFKLYKEHVRAHIWRTVRRELCDECHRVEYKRQQEERRLSKQLDCTDCKGRFDPSEFPVNSSRSSGRGPRCRSCQRKRNRERRRLQRLKELTY